MLRRPSPLLPTNGWAGAGKGRQRAKFSENIKRCGAVVASSLACCICTSPGWLRARPRGRRVLFLAGIAIVLIYCGLSFTSLSGAKRGGFRIIPGSASVKAKSARALAEENAQLQQPQHLPVLGGANGSESAEHADFDGHDHAPDAPCDESCRKHHSHLHPGDDGAEVSTLSEVMLCIAKRSPRCSSNRPCGHLCLCTATC
jgi:hypothetical protein